MLKITSSLLLILVLTVFTSTLYGDFYSSIDHQIHHTDGRRSVSEFEGTFIFEASRAVVAIQDSDHQVGLCTGALLSPNHVITSSQCKFKCDAIQVNLHYVENSEGMMMIGCKKDIVSSVSYDYRIFELDRTVTGITPLVLSMRPVFLGQQLMLIGQSPGVCKTVDYTTECSVSYPSYGELFGRKQSFAHGCDTFRGNVGSPLIDPIDMKIKGIQWAGSADPLNRFTYNYAIPSYKIVEDLYEKGYENLTKLITGN